MKSKRPVFTSSSIATSPRCASTIRAFFCRLRTIARSSSIWAGVTLSVLFRMRVVQNSICWMSRLSTSSSSTSPDTSARPPLNSSYMRAQSTTHTMLSSASGAEPSWLASQNPLMV